MSVEKELGEWSESIGSMPSRPQPKPSQQQSGSSNFGIPVGFALCTVSLFIFPAYISTDDLNTGIFYGVGLVMLIITISSLMTIVSGGQNKKPSTGSVTSSTSARPRRRRRMTGSLLCFVLVLFGIYLLTFPTRMAFFYGIGFIGLLVAIIVISRLVFMRAKGNRSSETTITGQNVVAPQQKQMSTGMERVIGFLFFGLYLLALPKIGGMSGLLSGILYGIGLTILLMTLVGLGNMLSKQSGDKVLPKQ